MTGPWGPREGGAQVGGCLCFTKKLRRAREGATAEQTPILSLLQSAPRTQFLGLQPGAPALLSSSSQLAAPSPAHAERLPLTFSLRSTPAHPCFFVFLVSSLVSIYSNPTPTHRLALRGSHWELPRLVGWQWPFLPSLTRAHELNAGVLTCDPDASGREETPGMKGQPQPWLPRPPHHLPPRGLALMSSSTEEAQL